MARLIFTLIALLLTACGSGAGKDVENQPTYLGISAFAIMNPGFPCEAFLETARKVDAPALSFLWGTFGSNPSCIQKWVNENKDKPHLIQIHFSNEVCRKKGNCRGGEFFGELTPSEYDAFIVLGPPRFQLELRHRVNRIKALIQSVANENTLVILSMGLEDQYSYIAANILHQYLKEQWPYEISRNPLDHSDPPVALVHELHGVQLPNLSRPNCIANLDGVSISTGEDNYLPSITPEGFSDFIRNNCECRAVFGWNAASQGIQGGTFVAPMDRKFVWSRKLIEAVDGILKC